MSNTKSKAELPGTERPGTERPGTEESGGVTPGYAWIILIVVFLASVVISMFWFSFPPLAGNIADNYDLFIQAGKEAGRLGALAHEAEMAGNFTAAQNYGEQAAAAGSIFGDLSWAMTSISITALIAAVPAAALMRRFGVKRILIAGMVFGLIGSVWSALSGTDYWTLVAARAVGGFGIGFIAVTATTAVSVWFSRTRRGFAMAIWSIWVPVSALIVYNVATPLTPPIQLPAPVQTGPDQFTDVVAGMPHTVWWLTSVLLAIMIVVLIIFYRMPRGNEVTDVDAAQHGKLKDSLRFLLTRQFICLIIVFLIFTAINHCFTTFNPTFFKAPPDESILFAGGLGMDEGLANLVSSITTSFGLLAPLFGVLLDRLHIKSKYVLLTCGAIALLGIAVFGFKQSVLGIPSFGIYVAFHVFANGILVACCRPLAPLFVSKGGIAAVSFGLALLTVCEFGGTLSATPFGYFVDMLNGNFGLGVLYACVPLGIIGVIAAFFTKPDRKMLTDMKPGEPTH